MVLLLVACVAQPEIEVTAEVPGLTLGKFVGGYLLVTEEGGETEASVHLTTYPDPCAAETAYYDALTEWMLANPDDHVDGNIELDAREAAFPKKEYHAVHLELSPSSAEELDRAYAVTAYGFEPGEAALRVEGGHTWYGVHSELSGYAGTLDVTTVDPLAGGAAAEVEGELKDYGETTGPLTLSFRGLERCETLAPARARYDEVRPDGC